MGVQAQAPELLQHEVDSPDLKGIDQLLAEKQDLDVMIKRGVDPVDMNKRLDAWILQAQQVLGGVTE